jgi:hypothetical protein
MLARVEPTNLPAGGRSIMTAFVDVKFRGLRIAQKAKLIEGESDAFVEYETPLPVGAPLSVAEEGKPERRARVVRVVEHEAGAGTPGMRVVWERAASAPAPQPEPEPEPVPETAAAEPAVDESGASDLSSDGVVEAPVTTGNSSGKKSKKSKKRR